MTKDIDTWDDDLEDGTEVLSPHEVEEAIAKSFSTLKVQRTIDGRVVITGSVYKKENNK